MGAVTYHLVRPVPAVRAAPVLDPQQQRVVGHDRGPLLVLAGPGTGKTTTLVEAAVARVRAGVPVEQLLMLTFSRRAAGELRDRVAARLDRTVREPLARTIHSYAFGVLRLAAVRDGEAPPRLLAAAEQDVVLRDLVAGSDPLRWPVALRPALHTRGFAAEIRDLLLRAVERGLDGAALAELGRRHSRPHWVSAGGLLTEYSQVTALERPGAYDPAELVRAAIDVLRDDPGLLAAERSRRRRLFVDEYQDTDPAQLELLRLLAAGAQELILVGDADQSIYAFRGADSGAIRDAGRLFGDGTIETVALGTCRRFGATLLEATRRVAARLPGPAAHRRLSAAAGLPAGEVEVALFRSPAEEADQVAAALRRAHLSGTPWSAMAVLVRSTTSALPRLRRAMLTAGVPVRVDDEDVPLADQPVVTMLLEILDHGGGPDVLDEPAAERLLLGPIGGLDALALRRLRRSLQQLAGSAQLAPALLDPREAAMLSGAAVARVAAVLAAARSARDGSPEEVLWAVWDATGLAQRWAALSRAGGAAGAAADRDLDAVVALFEAAARFTDRLPGAPVARFVEHVAAQQIPGEPAPRRSDTDAVSILTAHAAKGLEWDLVCVTGVQEGVWPDLRRRGSLLGSEALVELITGGPAAMAAGGVVSQLAEERRLFYVATTRARQRLLVTAVAGEQDQPSRFLDELLPPPQQQPGEPDRPFADPARGTSLTHLVAELRAAAGDPLASGEVRQEAAAQLARLATAGVPGADPGQWWGLAPLSDDGPVAEPDRPVSISPSRVEAYADCELRALLHDLGATRTGSAASSLGTVIHAVAAEAPPGADAAQLERLLDERFAAVDFGAGWFAEHERARARRMLLRLVDWLAASRDRLTLVGVEQDFAVQVGDARISGRVDRLERDRAGRFVVIDLKTGKHKVKDADVPAHPQLGAYQLAIEQGAFGAGERSGGAALVQLGSHAGAVEQCQVALGDADDPGWIAEQVTSLAELLRGNRFTATVGERCAVCDVRACCPLQAEGRQVTN
ncbi:MAG: ATP-dependent helicase [Jatrophihabitans sp.]|nr:MAG: ATP-dependent helicase [Jatrophihabitans sp.]